MRLGGVVIGAMIFWVPGMDESQQKILPVLVVPLLAVNSLFSFSWLSGFDSSSGFGFRLGFARPVATRTLVLVPLAYVAVTTWLTYAVPAALIGWFQDRPLPVFAPASAIMLTSTIMTTLSWSITNRFIRILCLGVGGAVLFATPVILLSTFENEKLLSSLMTGEFFRFGAWFYFSVAAGMAAAAVVTVLAVERQRHGELFLFAQLRVFNWDNTPVAARLKAGFSRPSMAQLAYEWRNFGVKVLQCAAAVVLGTVVLFAAIWFKLPEDQRLGRIVFCALFVVGLSPFALQIIACESAIGIQNRQGVARMSLFDLTRPLTSEMMLIAKLLMVAATSLLGWICVVVPVGLLIWLASGFADWSVSQTQLSSALQGVGWIWIGLFAIRLLMLFLVSSAGIMIIGLLLSKFPNWFAIACMCCFPVFIAMIADAKNGWCFQELWMWLGVLVVTAQASAAVWFIRKSIVTRSISRFSLLSVVGLCVGSMVMDWQTYQLVAEQVQISVTPLVFVSVLLSQLIPPALIISLPLAFAVHRHQ
jgi:hypothetical protein